MAKALRKKDTYGLHSPFGLAYGDRLVAFLDLLGFSRMVLDRKDEDVEFIVNLIPDMIRTHQGNVLRKDLEITCVSDSIIISVKAEPDEILKDLFHICVIVGRIQHELALNGIYMRGGISVGKMVHDSERNLIVGPAYVKAVELEGKICIVPRVVIDAEVLRFYGKDYNQMAEILNDKMPHFYYQGALVSRRPYSDPLPSGDNEIFVDYVSTFIGREKTGFEGTISRFLEHLEQALLLGVAFEKYLWLARYAIELIDSSVGWNEPGGRACLDRIKAIVAEASPSIGTRIWRRMQKYLNSV